MYVNINELVIETKKHFKNNTMLNIEEKFQPTIIRALPRKNRGRAFRS